jgi:hypothetical protein
MTRLSASFCVETIEVGTIDPDKPADLMESDSAFLNEAPDKTFGRVQVLRRLANGHGTGRRHKPPIRLVMTSLGSRRLDASGGRSSASIDARRCYFSGTPESFARVRQDFKRQEWSEKVGCPKSTGRSRLNEGTHSSLIDIVPSLVI